MTEPYVFKPHSEKQAQIFSSDADLTIAATGTQWGKSQVAALWLKRQIHTFTEKDDNFLILAPTFPILRQSSLPYFLQYMEGYGVYNASTKEFKLHKGGTCYLRTGTDPESIVGIPKTRAAWLDEGGKATLYFWEQIQTRAAAVGARLLISTSPYSRNWIYKQYIKPFLLGDTSTPIITAASWENPYHTLHDPVKRAAMRAKMDPRRFAMQFGGEWGQMIGLVYDCFDESENQCEPFDFPPGTKFYGGIDWGYNPDPFVLKIRAITPEGRHYGISEFYKTNLEPQQIVDICKQKKQLFNISMFYCDPSQPGYISMLNSGGVPASPADNDIAKGIAQHYELLKTRKLKYFKGLNPLTLDELETYHYPEAEDLGPDDNAKPTKPVDQGNHCFVAGTMITTINGEKPIEEICSEDLVLTRSGYKRVITAWSTENQMTQNFGPFECTHNHKIFTKNRGFVEAKNLRKGDVYYTLQECIQSRNSMGSRTSYIRVKGIFENLLRAVSPYIVLCGSFIMDLFQRVIISTTKTIIHTTTKYPTLSWLIPKRILKNIVNVEKKILSSLRNRERDWQKSIISQKYGTLQRKDMFGIKITLAKSLARKIEARFQSFAWYVTNSLKTEVLEKLSFAQYIASIRTGLGLDATMNNGGVCFVSPYLLSTNIQERNPVQPIAPPGLQTKQKVYNFIVEDAFEYFANGILVSNCMDADRYLSIMTVRSHLLTKPKVPVYGAKKNETFEQRIKRLTKSKSSRKYETWD